MRVSRLWVGGFVLALVVFGAGQLEAWPFTSWYMFSHVEQTPARVAQAIAATPTAELVLTDRTLPYGLLSHRLLRRVDQAASSAQRTELCASLITAAKRDHPELRSVRVVERRWDPLVRSSDGSPVVTTLERLRCPA